ncbi:endothelin-converting enzyme 1-like [Haemaphysalis longicornis]
MALVWSQVSKRAPTLLSGDIADDLGKMELLARQEMKDAAAKAPWMSQEEAAVAVLKVERLKVVLLETDSNETVHERHPDSPLFKNKSLIEAFYNLQVIRRAEYWRARYTESFDELLLETDSAFTTIFPYKPDSNEVLVSPAAIYFISTISDRLRVESVPFYAAEVLRDMFLAISIIGSTVNADGDLRKWWTSATEELYIKRAECLQKSFTDESGLYFKGGAGDDHLFVEENVVDGAVLRPLYKIHGRLVKERGRFDVIPGQSKDFDPNKLFFINWASTFCEPGRPETTPRERLRLKFSVPPRARLNIALSRFPPFSAAFSCPVGSEMNPSNACTFW